MKYGKKLLWSELNDETLIEKIEFILNDKEINEKVKRASDFMKTQKPFEKLKDLIDVGIQFKGKKIL